MASTYENDLRLEEMATGENSGSWGTKTNTNLELIADAFSYGTETIADADTTITIADGAADAARSLALKINSSADLTTTRTITLAPNTTSKVWIIENNTSGDQTLTISAGSGSNVTLPNGVTKIIATDGIGAAANVTELYTNLHNITIDGVLSLADGTNSAPSLTNTGDTNTGLYFPAADEVGITTGGTQRVKVDNTGVDVTGDLTVDTDTLYVDSTNDRVGVNVAAPARAFEVNSGTNDTTIVATSTDAGAFISFEDSNTTGDTSVRVGAIGDDLRFDAGNGEAMRIDSSQRVLIKQTSNIATNSSMLQVFSTGPEAAVNIHRGSASANAGYLQFQKSRNTTAGSYTIVENGDDLGNIVFRGDDGTAYDSEAAWISAEVDGTPGANDMPGRLVFKTTADGSNSATERMRIDSQGRVQINSTVAGSSSNVGQLRVNLPANGHSSIDNLVYIQGASGTGLLFGNHLDGDGYGGDIIVRGYSSTHGDLRFTRYTGNYTDPIQSMTIDSSGRVMIGNTTNIPVVNASLQFEVIGDTTVSGSGGIAAARFGGGATIALGGSPRSTTTGSYVIVQDEDNLGNIFFSGDDGTDLRSVAARISADVDGTPGANDMPGRLVFYTTADGSNSATERMRISSGGQVNIGDNMVVYSDPNLQIRSQDNTAIGAADLWSALNKPGIDVRNSSNTLFSYAGINFFGGTSSNSYAGINMVQTTANSKGALTFWTGGNGEGSPYAYERMRIASDGIVSVNTTSSTAQAFLQINGGSDGSGILTGRTDGGNGNNERFVITGFADGGGANYGGGIGFETRNTTNTFIEAMRIDSAQRLLKGYTSNIPTAGHNASIQAIGQGTADFHDATVSIVGFSNNSNGAYLNFGSGRSNTAGTYTSVANDDTVGQINFAAADGTDMVSRAAHITSQIDGAPGSNDTPGRIGFYTSSDGASNPTERMRIDSTGRTFVGNLSYISNVTTNSVLEAHGGSVVFGSGDGSNQQGYRTFVKFFQVNNSSGLPTSANLDLMGMTSEFYCKITMVGVNPYSGSNAFTYINESTGYAGGNFSVISANEYGAGSGISFGTATLFNPSGTDYRVRIPVTSTSGAYRFIVTAEIIGISNQDNPRFVYS